MTCRATLELKNAAGLRKGCLIWLLSALYSSKPQSLAAADESRGWLLAAACHMEPSSAAGQAQHLGHTSYACFTSYYAEPAATLTVVSGNDSP